MFRKLVDWLRGYVCIRIHGCSPERFLNLCSNRKLYIWDLKYQEEEYNFRISIKNFRKIRPIARKTKMLPRITKKVGLPFFLHRYRKRKGFVLGIMLCCILVYIMSLFIWDINILGGSKYTPEAMIKFLKENEVYTGIKKSKIDCQEIEETIRLAYKDIGWVSAEIKGTRLIIKITETNMPAPARKALAPSHMIATKDGIVQKIITRTGTPLVRPGDVVKKGDILVSGVVDVMADFDALIDKKPVVADADILCKAYYDYNSRFPMDYIEKDYTKSSKKGYYLTLFNKKLFLYNPRNSYDKYDIIVSEKTFHITDTFYLPIRYSKITTREYEDQKKTYTQEEAFDIAKAKIIRYFDELRKHGVKILENNIQITIENNYCIAKGRIIVEEPAWEYQPVQESEWRIEQTDEYNGDNH